MNNVMNNELLSLKASCLPKMNRLKIIYFLLLFLIILQTYIGRFCVLRFTAQLFTVYLFNYSNYFYCFYKDGNATKEKVLKGNFQMPI